MTVHERAPLLHNMSAPPRSVLTFRPVVPVGDAGDPSPTLGTGMRWRCRVRLGERDQALVDGLGAERAAQVASEPDHGGGRRVLALALAEEEGGATPSDALWDRVWALPAEALADELCAVALRVDLAALGYPRFGLFLREDGGARPSEPSLRVALALLARKRGRVFLREAEPLAPHTITALGWDLWVPLPASPEEGAP
ncbi:MAG: hypothetical protein IT360_14820 [Gemmatimonadaceae bacterium]|nr:hypothetical protein [Gemmatimonadaceae bacterium]